MVNQDSLTYFSFLLTSARNVNKNFILNKVVLNKVV